MVVYKFLVGAFGVNNYIVCSERSPKAIIIDAGEKPEPLLKKISELKLEVPYLINTHGHGDHIAGNRRIVEETGAKILIHELDAPFLNDPNLNLSAFLGIEIVSPPASRLLKENDNVTLEELNFKVLHTPGHTPGHLSLVTPGHAFVGDVIFSGSIGRTDLPLGSSTQLIESIRNKIYTLPDNTVLYPGHGENTTVKTEKRTNPFVSE